MEARLVTIRTDVSHLTGVPETMLWALYNRAAEARRPDAFLHDPDAIRIAEVIDYDYTRSFGNPESGQVIRALLTDHLLRQWLAVHPDSHVIALGEGLETQFCRVDNGSVHWLAVDVPESIAIHQAFLPDTDRHRNLACSALDVPRWIEGIPTQHAVFVTAVGLLKYFQPHEVRQLITTIADRLPEAELVFDVMPRALIKLSQKGWYRKGKSYTVPKMYWGLNRNEIHTIGTWHHNISEVIELPFSGGRGFQYRILLPILQKIPGVNNHLFSLVHVKCRNRKDR